MNLPHAETTADTLLEARGLSLTLDGRQLFQDLDFELKPGACLGLVGPSGIGKTLMALSLMGLQPRGATLSGSLSYQGIELLDGKTDWRRVRAAGMAMMPQQPRTSLNPVRRIQAQLMARLGGANPERRHQALEWLRRVGLADAAEMAAAFPHQLSGGQCQRVMMALALAGEPCLLIADEPTASLDTVARAEILELLGDLQSRLGFSLLLISHDLPAIVQCADRILRLGGAEHEPQPRVARNPSSDKVTTEPLLQAQQISLAFPSRTGRCPRPVLSKVSLAIHPGRCLGLVGVSGSGKTTLARILLGLQPADSGQVLLAGREIQSWLKQDRLGFRRQLQIVFQDPGSSLDPRQRVGEALAEALRLHGHKADPEACAACLQQVNLPETLLQRFPHQLSGGQRQRVALARALALGPRLLICDEPVSSLDREQQLQMLDLLDDIRLRQGLGLMLIAHDLSLVRKYCESIAVMADGRIVEQGPVSRVMGRPQQKETRRLLDAMPLGA